jgi:hypothetical protein
MRYALLLFDIEADAPAGDSPAGQEEWGAWMRITEEMASVTNGGEALEPSPTATTVRVRDGETALTDGPFAETKEVLGGFYIIDVPDLDTAVRWAARMPNVGRGSVEVRPVMEIPSA